MVSGRCRPGAAATDGGHRGRPRARSLRAIAVFDSALAPRVPLLRSNRWACRDQPLKPRGGRPSQRHRWRRSRWAAALPGRPHRGRPTLHPPSAATRLRGSVSLRQRGEAAWSTSQWAAPVARPTFELALAPLGSPPFPPPTGQEPASLEGPETLRSIRTSRSRRTEWSVRLGRQPDEPARLGTPLPPFGQTASCC